MFLWNREAWRKEGRKEEEWGGGGTRQYTRSGSKKLIPTLTRRKGRLRHETSVLDCKKRRRRRRRRRGRKQLEFGKCGRVLEATGTLSLNQVKHFTQLRFILLLLTRMLPVCGYYGGSFKCFYFAIWHRILKEPHDTCQRRSCREK